MLHSRLGFGVKRLEQDANAPLREARLDERMRVGELQQAGLDADAAADQALTELEDPGFALVRGHELGQPVQPATSSRRRPGSGSTAADVVSETGTPGQTARIARSAAAHGSGARLPTPAES